MGRNAQALSGQCQKGAAPFKKGRAVHSDAAQDKVLIKQMIKAAEKKEEKSEMKCGGKVGKKK